MDKNYEAVKDMLEEQMKKIIKKGDISPQELDNLYKASAIVLDFETKDAMKKAEEQGMDYYSHGSYEGGHSTHYPWFMYHDAPRHSMDRHGNSYDPIWNQGVENKSMHEVHSQEKRSYDNAYDGAYDGAYDANTDNSHRRGRSDVTGRYVSRDSGYSRAADKERMIGKLQDMMDDAPSEKERHILQQCVEKLEKQ